MRALKEISHSIKNYYIGLLHFKMGETGKGTDIFQELHEENLLIINEAESFSEDVFQRVLVELMYQTVLDLDRSAYIEEIQQQYKPDESQISQMEQYLEITKEELINSCWPD
jgi:hypothetical protein